MLNYIVNLPMKSQFIYNISWFSNLNEYVCVSLQFYGISLPINLNCNDFPCDWIGCLAGKDSHRIHNESQCPSFSWLWDYLARPMVFHSDRLMWEVRLTLQHHLLVIPTHLTHTCKYWKYSSLQNKLSNSNIYNKYRTAWMTLGRSFQNPSCLPHPDSSESAIQISLNTNLWISSLKMGQRKITYYYFQPTVLFFWNNC